MRIVIIGAGEAGRDLVRTLVRMKHDVVLVDTSTTALGSIEGELDMQTIQGDGVSPAVLKEAGADKADLLVAVSGRDDTNMLACIYGHAAGARYTIARASSIEYRNPGLREQLHGLGVNLVICQKEESARDMCDILRMPSAVEIADLLEGRMLAVGIPVNGKSPLTEAPIKDLKDTSMLEAMRLIALRRGGRQIVPHGDTQIRTGDEVYVVIRQEDADRVLDWADPERIRIEKVIVAGGGDVGLRLAQLLEQRGVQTVVIEKDATRAGHCSGILDHAVVLLGDALGADTLKNAGLTGRTAFVAAIGSDENNIIDCLLAQRLGAGFTLAEIAKPEYVSVIENMMLVDQIVSPHVSMMNVILQIVRGKNIEAVAALRKLSGEFLEVRLSAESRWTGRTIRALRIPRGAVIASVLRGEDILIPVGDLKLAAGDKLLIFSESRSVERLKASIGG